MWFLEHDILFPGKRMWLKPGTKQLFGRTSSKSGEDGKHVGIDHKGVSRQHMMLKVLPVAAGAGTKLHTQSHIHITDLSGRQGITVDGQKNVVSKKEGGEISSYGEIVLDGTEHTLKLSSYPEFRLKWQPIVLTLASRDSKTRAAQLHPYDIKSTSEFVFGKTTHVVSQKRNLPKVLQGLVAGVHIVTTDFIDAILKVAAAQDASQDNYLPSQLEEDFQAWWPKEKEFVPPVGVEPRPRPGEMLEPDPRRAEVFSGLSVIFLNESQYNTLQDPVAGGNGKALLFAVDYGKTTVDDYVQYARNVAGEKRRGRVNGERVPIVTVRLINPPEEMEEWAAAFIEGIDRALNQRSVPQNEFLDAIIMNDASVLQQPLPEREEVPRVNESANSEQSAQNASQHASKPASSFKNAPNEVALVKDESARSLSRKRAMRRAQSRFTGFDDFEPPSKVRRIEQDSIMEDVADARPTQSSLAQSHGPSAKATQRSRRLATPVNDLPDELATDELFPAAAKLQKIREADHGASNSVELEAPGPETVPKTKRGAAALARLQEQQKKHMKEINVREETRLRLQQEEQKIKDDEEHLREMLDGVDISELRDLVKIETMDIPERRVRNQPRTAATESDRWKDEWNGRKNFKKFRRRGVQSGQQAPKVIVGLEEVPLKRGMGIGDTFLEESEPALTQAEERRSRTEAGRANDSESDQEPGFVHRKRSGKEREVVNVESSDVEEVAPRPSASQKSRTQRVPETQLAHTQTRGSKRAAPVSVTVGQPAGKRSKVTRREEDSDNEETGFRLRRKR